jgi:anti-sigma regulatory factor (Ser/Thr protein kinase)
MASDEPPAWPPRGDPGLDRAVLAQDEAGAPSVLDQWFDATSLSALRVSIQACAAQAGMSADRATDVVIALHELAANAVRHGAGSGRLRVWDRVGALYCRVDDVGPAAAGGSPGTGGGDIGTEDAGSVGQNLADRWPYEPGHGLWLARQVADQMSLRSDSSGTRVVVTFSLDAIP